MKVRGYDWRNHRQLTDFMIAGYDWLDIACSRRSRGARTKHGPGVHGPPLWTGSMDHFHGPG